MMKRYIATVFYRGIGNATYFIDASDYDAAFKKLFTYHLDKGDRLGSWIDADGEEVSDFDEVIGVFENDKDWDWLIVRVDEVKTIS